MDKFFSISYHIKQLIEQNNLFFIHVFKPFEPLLSRFINGGEQILSGRCYRYVYLPAVIGAHFSLNQSFLPQLFNQACSVGVLVNHALRNDVKRNRFRCRAT